MTSTEPGYAARLLAAALDYATAGVHVFPLRITINTDGRKTVLPCPDWDGASTTDHTTIQAWFSPGGSWEGAGLGIDTGKSHLGVVDPDGPDGITAWRALVDQHTAPATYRAATPGGGEHHYYRDQAGELRNTTSSIADHVDTRGVGGFVIAPPTRDARGAYRWLEGAPQWTELPPVPQFVHDATRRRHDHTTPRPGTTADGTPRQFTAFQARRFVDAALTQLRTARDGTINKTLYETALVTSHFGPEFWPVEDGVRWLHDALACTVYDGRTWKAEATIRSAYGAPNWRATLVDHTGAAQANATFEDEFVDRTTPPGPPTAVQRAPATADTVALPNLPLDFWEARPALRHIRQAAHARWCSADAVLHATLARLSAMVSPELRFDSGRGPASLNYFAALVGASGIGKSTSARVARRLIAAPAYLAPAIDGTSTPFRDGTPLGSGEGIAEAFMGMKEIEVGEKANGQPLTKKVRGRVRSNVFAVADEGEMVTKLGERNGSTIGATIRSAWGCETIGQMNAREETTRIVEADSYSLGLLIGFQPKTALPLLVDTATGTAQRFGWSAVLDPTIPDDPVPHPGALALGLGAEGWRMSPVTGVMPFPVQVIDDLRREHLAKTRGELVVDEQDSQAPLMRCKVAGLLAVLDGRVEVLDGDWQLAGIVVGASRGVREALAEYGRSVEADEAEKRVQAAVERHVRAAAAAEQTPAKVQRFAVRIAAKVAEEGRQTRNAAGKAVIPGRERGLRDAAIDSAIADGLVVEGSDGALYPPTPRAV